MNISKTLVISLILAFVCSVVACGGGSDNSDDSTGFLYIQDSTSGTFVPLNDGQFLLRLVGVSPNTNFFSDRSLDVEPTAGTISTSTFVSDWDNPGIEDNFEVDPPNAALDVVGPDGGQSSIALQLFAPVYDAANSTLEYRARSIETFPESVGDREVTEAFPSMFSIASLFIDDGSVGDDETLGDCIRFIDSEILRGELMCPEMCVQNASLIASDLGASDSCKQVFSTSDKITAAADYIVSVINKIYRSANGGAVLIQQCGVHGSCGSFSTGTSFDECFDACTSSGCDVTYSSSSCWCTSSCFGRFLPR